MEERLNRATMLLPNGPWYTPEPASKRSFAVWAVEIGSLVAGMGGLFLFGHGLGSNGDLNLMPLAVGAAATASVFLAPDALHRRLSKTKAMPYPSARNLSYSEDKLLEQWPARRERVSDAVPERKAS